MPDRLLHAEGEQDDAGHHREVQVAVGVPRDARAGHSFRLGHLSLRHDRNDVEVGPPECCRDHHAQDCGQDDPATEVDPGGPDPDRDDRLSEGDDHDQSVTLGEMRREDAPPAASAEERPRVVDRQRDEPNDPLGGPVEGGGS